MPNSDPPAKWCLDCSRLSMIKVILADHQRIFCAGLASTLATEDDICIVGQPQSVEQLLRGLVSFLPHVLILSSAYLSRIDEIKRVCSLQRTAILVLEESNGNAFSGSSTGTPGILCRSASETAVVESVRQLARGGTAPPLVRNVQTEADPVGIRVRQRLSLYELRIIALVVQGHRNREIAALMVATEHSVKRSLRKIFDKTGVFGRLELALFVLHHRILQQAPAGLFLRPGSNATDGTGLRWPRGQSSLVN